MAVAVIELAVLVEERAPKLRMIQSVGGVQVSVDSIQTREIADVRQQAAERNADQQQRLEALDDAKVQKHEGKKIHDEVLTI